MENDDRTAMTARFWTLFRDVELSMEDGDKASAFDAVCEALRLRLIILGMELDWDLEDEIHQLELLLAEYGMEA
jgi:hypothetical protein